MTTEHLDTSEMAAADDAPAPLSSGHEPTVQADVAADAQDVLPTPDRRAATDTLITLLGHTFADPAVLREALTHPSYRNEHPDEGRDNQRLEFLGDSVLGLAVSEALFQARPDAAEGTLTTVRARVVSEPVLADAARASGLADALRLGRGVVSEGGADRDSVLSDAFEAVLGALFVDGGYPVAREVALRLLAAPIRATLDAASTGGLRPIHHHARNWKTALQEHLQSGGAPPPTYTLVRSAGPAHARRFTMQVQTHVGEIEHTAQGQGRSKKAAEHAAAHALLRDLHVVARRSTGRASVRERPAPDSGATATDDA